MISIDNQPLIDMMKTIDYKFIEDHSNKIKIEPTVYSIIVKFIRDPETSIRDIIMVFDGDGVMKVTGLHIDGIMIRNKVYDISDFVKEPKMFNYILRQNFGIDMI